MWWVGLVTKLFASSTLVGLLRACVCEKLRKRREARRSSNTKQCLWRQWTRNFEHQRIALLYRFLARWKRVYGFKSRGRAEGVGRLDRPENSQHLIKPITYIGIDVPDYAMLFFLFFLSFFPSRCPVGAFFPVLFPAYFLT